MKLRKTGYYVRSLLAVLGTLDNPHRLPCLVLGRAVALDLDGRRVWMSSALDVLVFKEVCIDDEYRLGELVDPHCIVDVGAGVGEFAVEAARRHPRARVLCFEPDPARYALLKRTIDDNDCTRVETHRAAVGTDAFRLDRLNLPAIDLLKIDCEGAEFDVLESLSPAQLAVTRRVALEYHDTGAERRSVSTSRFLGDHGFAVEVVPDRFDPSLGHVYASRAPASGGQGAPLVRKT